MDLHNDPFSSVDLILHTCKPFFKIGASAHKSGNAHKTKPSVKNWKELQNG